MGFSTCSWRRNVDVLVMSPSDLDDAVLPSGRLREPLDAARRRTACSCQGRSKTCRAWQRRSIACRCSASRITSDLVQGLDASAPSGTRVVAVAGIARPERFFTTLREQGFEIVRELRFPDHHWFTPEDLDRIRTIAKEASADLVVTTEKDAVRVAPQPGWAALPMTAVIRAGAELFCRHGSGNGCETSPRICVSRDTVQACLRVLPMTAVRACGGALGATCPSWIAFIAASRWTIWRRRFHRGPSGRTRGVPRDVRALRQPAARDDQVRRSSDPSRCWSAWRSRGRSACGRRIGRAGRAVLHRTLRLLGDAGDRIRRCMPSRSPSWRGRSTTRICTRCSSGFATRTGNAVIYRQGALRRVLRDAARQPRRGDV